MIITVKIEFRIRRIENNKKLTIESKLVSFNTENYAFAAELPTDDEACILACALSRVDPRMIINASIYKRS